MLKTAKILSKARKALDEAVTSSQQIFTQLSSGIDTDPGQLREWRRIAEARRTRVEAAKEVVEKAIEKLEAAFQGMDAEHQQQEQEGYENYLETANDATLEAEILCTRFLEAKTEVDVLIQDLTISRTSEREASAGQNTSAASSSILPSFLPRLEIPKFSGKRSEWDSFWSTFKTNIDDQQISPMLKFNYLRQYLTGQARELISQFQMNEANYPQAISCLKEKYGDDDVMVEELLAEIQESKAQGRGIAAQTQLLEKISALMSQLAVKGEDVDHRMLLNTIFSKFDLEIQAKALERRADLENPKEWTWSRMRKELIGVLERKSYIERIQGQTNPQLRLLEHR